MGMDCVAAMVAAEMLKEKKTRAGARATQEGARADHPDSEGLGCAWTAAGPGGERKPNKQRGRAHWRRLWVGCEG
jgi:hypothetical protein